MRALLLASLLLVGCAIEPPAEKNAIYGKYKNACLPEAVIMVQSLHKAEIQAKVLKIDTTQWSHAVVVYLYPAGDNSLWVWDSMWKSLHIRAWWNNPSDIATRWMQATRQQATLVNATFLE